MDQLAHNEMHASNRKHTHLHRQEHERIDKAIVDPRIEQFPSRWKYATASIVVRLSLRSEYSIGEYYSKSIHKPEAAN